MEKSQSIYLRDNVQVISENDENYVIVDSHLIKHVWVSVLCET